jgi:hypothetical protein
MTRILAHWHAVVPISTDGSASRQVLSTMSPRSSVSQVVVPNMVEGGLIFQQILMVCARIPYLV